MINKFKKKYCFPVITAIFVAAIFFLFSYNFLTGNEKENNNGALSRVCFNDNCFNVEIADTPQKRETGLMFRKQLAKNSGMLFAFDQADVYQFWMKNTLIPLDMIWIDEDNKIIYMQKNVPPCEVEPCEMFGPDEKALYILETKGGAIEEMGLEAGDEMVIAQN